MLQIVCQLMWQILYRSSRPEVFCKKGVLTNFAKFTGKYLCQSLFFNKVVGLSPATLLKKRLCHMCFPDNFVKFVRTPFLKEHLWWLLLNMVKNCHWDDVNLLNIVFWQYFTNVPAKKFFEVFLIKIVVFKSVLTFLLLSCFVGQGIFCYQMCYV